MAQDVLRDELMLFFSCPQAAIRKELNEFKSTEMEVHASSKHLTRSAFLSVAYVCVWYVCEYLMFALFWAAAVYI